MQKHHSHFFSSFTFHRSFISFFVFLLARTTFDIHLRIYIKYDINTRKSVSAIIVIIIVMRLLKLCSPKITSHRKEFTFFKSHLPLFILLFVSILFHPDNLAQSANDSPSSAKLKNRCLVSISSQARIVIVK